jgi:hypothetical protein
VLEERKEYNFRMDVSRPFFLNTLRCNGEMSRKHDLECKRVPTKPLPRNTTTD